MSIFQDIGRESRQHSIVGDPKRIGDHGMGHILRRTPEFIEAHRQKLYPTMIKYVRDYHF